ncbi:MAG: VOC family protein [Paracoccaceae bacterium]
MSTSSAPIEISRVALTVADPALVGRFYETALGLRPISASGGVATYGAGGRVLLELRADPAARRATPREAGLFHTAFLMPSRADLGRWLVHAAETGVRLQGASDHLVSEAIYLSDPEGNGIEVYRDRPRGEWPKDRDGNLRMASDPLDLEDIARAAPAPWAGAPEGLVVGHVHLQVGDVAEAEAFYSGTLGFGIVTHYPGASFMGAGGYHHHLGANVWNSRGAARRSFPSTGLADLEIRADAASLAAIEARTGGLRALTDPWGTPVTVTAKAPAAVH